MEGCKRVFEENGDVSLSLKATPTVPEKLLNHRPWTKWSQTSVEERRSMTALHSGAFSLFSRN